MRLKCIGRCAVTSHLIRVSPIAALAIIPYWIISFPPATDLPQHLSQIVLAKQVLSGLRTDMVLSPWYFPNTFVYALVAAAMAIAEPVIAGKIVMSSLMAAWLASTYYLAYRLRRPLINWLIASLICYNFLFYWGLLNFLIGWPIFCLFLTVISAGQPKENECIKTGLVASVILLLLYFCHSLWFLCANGVLVVLALTATIDRKHFRSLLFATLPTWTLAFVWFPQLSRHRSSSGIDIGVDWGRMPASRLETNEVIDALFGGISSPIELIATVFIILWVLTAITQHRKNLDAVTNKTLFISGALLILAWLAFPDKYMNTLFFSNRWLPEGMILLLLSLPAPRIPGRLAIASVFSLAVMFSLLTSIHWRAFEAEECDGLDEALAAITPEDRVLSLNHLGGGAYVKGQPFLQISSYSQALHGNEIHFSFAEHYSGIVLYRGDKDGIRTPKKVWAAARDDLDEGKRFNRLLLGDDPRGHAFVAEHLGLQQITSSNSSWRLYRRKTSG